MTDSGDALARAEEAELSRRREDSVVSPLADSDERVIESALRPKRLDDFVGQARVREQLTLLLRSALRRQQATGPRAAVRAARPRQDDDRDDHRG